ncbi:helix-turn-helix transcriptional regulator [Vagococcus intermedius]|uniref:PAS domain-containing protein n=1 Tax=Vagococcus intermedius TaxID=2991418 RepID=A0AAF0I8H1_9ENTE|nr:PAS domain-containing protein [Vagococcus intermedius]WEG74144.1 PAS domain-containing protein [Vagococcus intermedius]WEG76223.1 PAS domain-containing protein [Vagococcus intermedius]
MNINQIAFYSSLTKFLGATLGENYEIIFHVLETDNYHIAAIENNHVSGRTVNSPITGFALELIKSGTYIDKDFVTDYKTQTVNGTNLKGSTFFIKNEYQELEGMLCINQDTHRYEELSYELLALAGLTSHSLNDYPRPCQNTPEILKIDSVEILEDSIEGMIYAIVSPDLLEQKIILSKELKLEIIKTLEEKGVFQIKGAVARVADIMNISEPSVYRYLKILETKE